MSVRQSSVSERLYLESADGGAHGDCVTLAQIGEHPGGMAPSCAFDPESGDVSNSMTGTSNIPSIPG